MTKKELSQLFYLNREIEEQQRRLAELEAGAISCNATITGVTKASGVSDKIAKYAVEIADLKALMDLNLMKCFYELNRIKGCVKGVMTARPAGMTVSFHIPTNCRGREV